MAETSKVNLIEEFGDKQENNDYILLSTFRFDPAFFDIYLMDRIKEKNPFAEIFVLMDGNEYNKTYPQFTKHTGRAYHLIPVFPNSGVFHPKLSIFASENKITTYVGSCNLTLAGFTSNAELITKVDSEIEIIDSVASDAIGYYKAILDKRVIQNNTLTEAIAEVMDRVKSTKTNEQIKLLHNLDEPILHQILRYIKKIDKVILFAPFWSQNTKILETLNRDLKEVNILIQDNNHNLTNWQEYLYFCRRHNIKIRFLTAKFEKNRRFHSKLIVIDSTNSLFIAGSSNMTEYALLKTANMGNFEICVLIKGDANRILEQISLREITNLYNISKGAILLPSETHEKVPIIHFVEFDCMNQKLIVGFEIPKSDATLRINFEGESSKEYKINNQSQIEICCQSIPFEVELNQNGLTAKRRVFYDDNYFYRKIAKGELNLTEINRKLSTDFSIDTLTILRLVAGLNFSLAKESSVNNRVKTSQKQKEGTHKFGLPSRESSTSHTKRLLSKFSELYKIINYAKLEEREREESSEEIYNLPARIPYTYQGIIDNSSERKKVCAKLLRATQELLIYKASLEENSKETLVASCSLLIQFAIKVLAPVYMDPELLQMLRDFIKENIKGTELQTTPETKKFLYFNLVLLNYYSGNKVHHEYEFISDIFDLNEVFEEQFIKECLQYVTHQVIQLGEHDLADDEEILEYAGLLASDIPNTKTITRWIVFSIEKMVKLPEEFWPFFAEYFSNLKKWSFSKEVINQLEEKLKTLTTLDTEKRNFIEEIIKEKKELCDRFL